MTILCTPQPHDIRVNDVYEIDVSKAPHLLTRAPRPVYRITIRHVEEHGGYVYFKYEARIKPGMFGMTRVPRNGFETNGPQLKLVHR